ncbi:MAG: hypothetical protein HEQ13_26055 [Dolichospermum sp. DEX189]|nr:hypothetical protein [Dolichospermum sp. DEX189]
MSPYLIEILISRFSFVALIHYIGIRFDSVNLLVWSGNREQGTGNRKDRIDTY